MPSLAIPATNAPRGSSLTSSSSSSHSASLTYGGFETTRSIPPRRRRRQGLEPTSVHQRRGRQLGPGRPRSPGGLEVRRRHRQRVGADIGRPQSRRRPEGRARSRGTVRWRPSLCRHRRQPARRPSPNRRCGRAAAATDGQEPPGLGHSDLDHLLGLGPRDEDPRVYEEIEAPERPMPEHILQRLPGGTPGRHRPRRRHHVIFQRPRRRARVPERQSQTEGLVDDEAGFVRCAHHRRQLGHELAAGRTARTTRHSDSSIHDATANARTTERHHAPSASSPASWRARLSAISASVSSVRSPASTWSSL